MNEVKQLDFKTMYYTDEDRNKIYKIMRDVTKNTGCIYLSYVTENMETGYRMGFSSNTDWQNEYIGDHLIDHCHLWKSVLSQFIKQKRNFLILPWETTSPTNSIEKDILLYRQEKHIGNGLSFCSQNKIFREYFAIAPETNSHNFLYHVSANINNIKQKINLLREETSKYFLKKGDNYDNRN